MAWPKPKVYRIKGDFSKYFGGYVQRLGAGFQASFRSLVPGNDRREGGPGAVPARRRGQRWGESGAKACRAHAALIEVYWCVINEPPC